MDADLERYSKQVLFRQIGPEGQRRIMSGRVLVCGCGALGSSLADGLVRAGVGFVRIVDRDFVELSNLQRQLLFDEEDVAGQLPKAVAAARKLSRINSRVQIDPHVADLDHTNILKFAEGVDLILDGMDNFETRFLINDAALEKHVPWVYAGCLGSHGQTMTIIPGQTACLRCLMESPPVPGESETCDTAGILAPIISVMTALQITAALKILSGHPELLTTGLTIVDVWDLSLRQMNTQGLRERGNCPACVKGDRDWLHGKRGSQSSVLCGRNAVQIYPPERVQLSLSEVAQRLQSAGKVVQNAFLLRLEPFHSAHQITIFPDGRAIIKGTEDLAAARTLYARYVGT